MIIKKLYFIIAIIIRFSWIYKFISADDLIIIERFDRFMGIMLISELLSTLN